MCILGKESNRGKGLEAVYKKRKEDCWRQRVQEKSRQDAGEKSEKSIHDFIGREKPV